MSRYDRQTALYAAIDTVGKGSLDPVRTLKAAEQFLEFLEGGSYPEDAAEAGPMFGRCFGRCRYRR